MAAQPPFQPPQGQQQPPAAPAAGQPQQQAPANIAAELWNWVRLASLPLVLFHAFVIFVMPLLVLWMQFHALEIGHGGDKPNAVWWAAVSGLTVVFFATFPILFELAIGFLAIGEATIPGILRTYFASIGKLLAHIVGLLAIAIFVTDLAAASWDDVRTAYIAALLIAVLSWGLDATDRMKTWWLVLAIDLCAAIIASFFLTYADWHPSGYTGTVFSWLQANKEVIIALGIAIDLFSWATIKETSGLGFNVIVWPVKKAVDLLSKMTWTRVFSLLIAGGIAYGIAWIVFPEKMGMLTGERIVEVKKGLDKLSKKTAGPVVKIQGTITSLEPNDCLKVSVPDGMYTVEVLQYPTLRIRNSENGRESDQSTRTGFSGADPNELEFKEPGSHHWELIFGGLPAGRKIEIQGGCLRQSLNIRDIDKEVYKLLSSKKGYNYTLKVKD